MRFCQKLYDRIRIDHFRGFASYYAIAYGNKDATSGKWMRGPGIDFFDALFKKIGNIDIIAEDLGELTPDVAELLDFCACPGMKVLQFAFDPCEDSSYLPHNHIRHCVLYTGTHDNDTILGWYRTLCKEQRAFADEYLRIKNESDVADALICSAMSSVAKTVIIPISDYLKKGSEARMNTPSTIGKNWLFRVKREELSCGLADKIAKLTHIYRRGTK